MVSLHAGSAVNPRFKVTAGIDNLFDEACAEHPNLAGSAGFGSAGAARINAPGRNMWLRSDWKF
ncbi:MAG: hypothetical protein GAK38_00892 [Xylophilus sp.]|nr:MAG: hypothetical protein GAK38_00892 [Xylophilus sp.]